MARVKKVKTKMTLAALAALTAQVQELSAELQPLGFQLDLVPYQAPVEAESLVLEEGDQPGDVVEADGEEVETPVVVKKTAKKKAGGKKKKKKGSEF